MRHHAYFTPAYFPDLANRWTSLGIDPRHFFRQDGSVDKEFFAVPTQLPATLSAASPTENERTFLLLVNISNPK